MIAINAKPAFGHPRTGLEEYAYQIITHLIEEARVRGLEKYLSLYVPTWSNIPQEFLTIDLRVIKASRLWTQGRLALQLFWDSPDIFFTPEQVLPRFVPKQSIVTVHDIAYELYPEVYSPWQRRYLHMVTSSAVKRAKKIIAISERTKRDLGKYYAVPQSKIEVVYHATSPFQTKEFQKVTAEIVPSSLPTKKSYILFMGRIEKKKNISSLIEAFEICWTKFDGQLALVLAGAPGFGYHDIERHVEASSSKNDIFLLGYVEPGVKYSLYQHASLFAFPSLYEGFGLPVLEAQSFGIPVITSNTSCLPEIAGNGALLVDPLHIGEMSQAISDLINKKRIRSHLIKGGYENLKRFSWERAARETLDILLSL